MSLKIRLRQQGRKNQIVYRLVLSEAESRRDGKYLELLGWYNPHIADTASNLSIKDERIFYWLSQGAELTDKAASLVRRAAPKVFEEYLNRKLSKRAAICKKRREYRKRLSSKPEA